jgi:hypothetical protein
MAKDPRHTISDTYIDSNKGRLTVTPPPSDLKVPDSDSFIKQEGTPVVDKQEIAWGEIGKMSKHLRGLVRATNNQAEYVRQIPEIKADVKAAKVASREALQKVEIVHTKLGTQMDNMDRRVGKVEDRSHDCAQVAVIADLREATLETRRKVETDIAEGVKTRERLDNTRNDVETVDTEVKKFSTARRNFFMGLIGVFVFIAANVGGLIWFLSALDQKVESEQREREDVQRRLENQMEKLGKVANTAPVQREMENLTKAVKASNGHETIEQYCAALSDGAVRRMKRTLSQEEWPRCRRFGLEPIRHREE